MNLGVGWILLFILIQRIYSQTWEPCDVLTNPCPTCDPNPKGFSAECTLQNVPLDWNNKNSTQIQIFVKRIFPSAGYTSRDMWLLMGGPGFSGSSLDQYAVDLLTYSGPNTSIYIPDQRGTGRSSFLAIPECGFSPSCLNSTYGTVLPFYSVTQTARDIVFLVDIFGLPNREKILYGWSYGTYLLNRVIQIQPTVGNKYVFEGLCPPGSCSFDFFDFNTNNVATTLLNLCATISPTCKKNLGPYPSNIASLVFRQMDAGILPCLSKLNQTLVSKLSPLSNIFRSFFANCVGFKVSQVILPAVLKRLFVCSDSDVTDLNFLLALEAQNMPSFKRAFGIPADNYISPVLTLNLIASELATVDVKVSKTTPDLAKNVIATENSLIASFGMYSNFLSLTSETYPAYSLDEYYSKYATFSAPYLLIQGELDPQTQYGFVMEGARNFPTNGQTIVSVPYGVHQSSDVQFLSPASTCTMGILSNFVNSTEAPNLQCLQEIPPPDFEGTGDSWKPFLLYLLGTDSLWGN